MTSDHPEHEWDDLDEAPPTPEEQAAAAQFALALAHKEPDATSALPDAVDISTHIPGNEKSTAATDNPPTQARNSAPAPELAMPQAIEDALSIAQLLQHQAHPPTLAPTRKDAIEAAFLDIFDQHQAAQLATAQVQATNAQATSALAPGGKSQAPQQEPLLRAPVAAGWRSWMERFVALFATGPRLALGGAFVAIMALASVWSITQTKQMAPTASSTKNRTIPQERWVVAQLSSSPWQPGQDPFAVTNSPDQRIERVLEHNSQRALESSLEARSRFYVLR